MAPWTVADIPDLSGRTALVTGANSGLGLRTAEGLAAAGARVLLGCRDPERGEAARRVVADRASGDGPEVVALDLVDLDAVAAAAAEVADRVEALDILVNNAGVMALPLRRSAQGHELQFATNHLGHFALCGRLLTTLLAAPAPRVVTVSSVMHRMGRIRWDDPNWERGRYSKWQAYGQSKLANLLFSSELARRAQEAGTALVSAAAHPGWSATNLQLAGPRMAGNRLMEGATAVANRLLGQSDEMGALPQLYAATMPEVAPDAYYGPDGPFEQRGHPTEVGRSPAAADRDAARRLWELSERLTGVVYDWPS